MLGFEVVFAICILSIAFALFLAWRLLKKDQGTEKMQAISTAIREGANAFMKRQYTTIAALSIVLALLIFGVYFYIGEEKIGTLTSASFLFGAFSSGLAGFIGMWTAIRANIRTASAARRSMNEALVTALRGGAVSGIIIVSMSLLGIATLYTLLSYFGHPHSGCGRWRQGGGQGESHAVKDILLAGGREYLINAREVPGRRRLIAP